MGVMMSLFLFTTMNFPFGPLVPKPYLSPLVLMPLRKGWMPSQSFPSKKLLCLASKERPNS